MQIWLPARRTPNECPSESAWVATESVVEIGIVDSFEEIQSAVERLPSPEQETLFRFLAVRLGAKSAPIYQPYQTRTHPGQVRPGIDADKLGQCALASTDSDFGKFPGLRWFNPLAPVTPD